MSAEDRQRVFNEGVDAYSCGLGICPYQDIEFREVWWEGFFSSR